MAPCWAIVDLSQHSSSFLDVVVEKKFSNCRFGVRRRFGGRKKSVVKEDTWFVGIHLLVKVLSSGKEISDSVRVTQNMGQFVVEILKVLDPVGLAAGNLLRLAEILEILVIGSNLDWLCSTEEEGSTTLESKEDRCEFLVSRSGHRVDIQRRSRNAGFEKFNRTSKSQPTRSRAQSRLWQYSLQRSFQRF
jgi:hypothetical protein